MKLTAEKITEILEGWRKLYGHNLLGLQYHHTDSLWTFEDDYMRQISEYYVLAIITSAMLEELAELSSVTEPVDWPLALFGPNDKIKDWVLTPYLGVNKSYQAPSFPEAVLMAFEAIEKEKEATNETNP